MSPKVKLFLILTVVTVILGAGIIIQQGLSHNQPKECESTPKGFPPENSTLTIEEALCQGYFQQHTVQ